MILLEIKNYYQFFFSIKKEMIKKKYNNEIPSDLIGEFLNYLFNLKMILEKYSKNKYNKLLLLYIDMLIYEIDKYIVNNTSINNNYLKHDTAFQNLPLYKKIIINLDNLIYILKNIK